MTNHYYPLVQVKDKIAKIIQAGHPWIFSGGVSSSSEMEPGELCEIHNRSTFLGIGFWNSHSDIRIRIITYNKRKIDKQFIIDRLESCYNRRAELINNNNAFRLVNGESDFLPGLIIDVYCDTAIIQIHSLGMEKLKPILVEALVSMKRLDFKCIYEKSSSDSRMKEGLKAKNQGILHGNLPELIHITENNFHFNVDVLNGQKTGFFLDQCANRNAILPYVKNKKVLNCFSYTGGFSVYAASVAKKVVSVDISKQAIDGAILNFRLNGFCVEHNEFIVENVFHYLESLNNGDYDCIIIDPPSMAKNKNSIPNAIKAYISLNTMALRILPENGILITSSCTTLIDDLSFIKILHQSGVSAECRLQVLESKLQPFDHPYLLSYPEGRYLKFYILIKIRLD